MANPGDRDTRDLIRRLKSERKRRSYVRMGLIGFGAVVILAVIITGIVLAGGWLGGGKQPAETTVVGAGATTSTTAKKVRSTTTPAKGAPPTERPAAATSSESSTASTASTTAAPTTSTTNWLSTKVVAIDPGHQGRLSSRQEPIGPGSKQTKAEVSGGTSSPTTGTPESVVTLAVGLKLRAALEARGIKVVMTRTTQDVDVSNVQRAEIANKAHADLAIRLHCNGSPDRSAHGLFTLYPTSIKGWTDDIAAPSKRAATLIQKATIAATGARDQGLQPRGDLTGFNWSDVPVALVEMGYMTNAAEDKLLESGTYQDKIVQGLVNGIIEFLRTG